MMSVLKGEYAKGVKMGIRKNITQIKALIKILPGLIKGLMQNTLAGYLVNAANLRDASVYVKYWSLNWIFILRLGLMLLVKKGPLGLVRVILNSPWVLILLRVNGLCCRLARGRSGIYLEAICTTVHTITMTLEEQLEDIFLDHDNLVVNEDLVPTDIVRAMGLKAWLLEAMGILLPILAPEADLRYIDEAENAGINPDACSLPKATVGMVLKGHMPSGVALVSSNMPCDAGAASYSLIQQELKVPIYRLDVPFNFYNERAEKHFAGDLKDMIAWLEENTPGRMDWKRLREICEGRNRMRELELELWDLIRIRPAPLAGEAVILSHLWHFNLMPGHKTAIRHYENLVRLAKKNLEQGIPATKNERYRAVLWNPPFCQFIDLLNWAERTYGLTLINDSMTYNRHRAIDTSTPDSMLLGLASTIMQGPMVRHTRGPAENYLDDIFRMYKQFDLDMVWIANHVGCKTGQAMNGILRERCRAMKIPLLILDYDLLDNRIVSHEGMMNQVEHFMENVMKAKRLDQ
ncbi:MAG TPA: 2-hydroxyacyl-CoA dehydratase family protein [Desulfomonilia bacterium]